MKVRYAAQALSSSVSDAFDFCENVLKVPQFRGASATSKFGKLKYLLTHKLSQDHAENFFGSVRGRGGYNNNPTAAQFMAAYKRLLVQAEVTSSSSGNCTKDMVFILNATTVLAQVDAASTLTYMRRSSILEPHDDHYTPPENLSAVVVAVVPYIAGFVVHQVCKTRTCEECIAALYSDEPVPLVEQKNREEKLFQKLEQHILDLDPFDNHIYSLCKKVAELYLKIRIHNMTKERNHEIIKDRVRPVLSRMIIFQHQ
ncbi:hypothetical protein MRX96_028967 [Rhipicephalus microplus]